MQWWGGRSRWQVEQFDWNAWHQVHHGTQTEAWPQRTCSKHGIMVVEECVQFDDEQIQADRLSNLQLDWKGIGCITRCGIDHLGKFGQGIRSSGHSRSLGVFNQVQGSKITGEESQANTAWALRGWRDQREWCPNSCQGTSFGLLGRCHWWPSKHCSEMAVEWSQRT